MWRHQGCTDNVYLTYEVGDSLFPLSIDERVEVELPVFASLSCGDPTANCYLDWRRTRNSCFAELTNNQLDTRTIVKDMVSTEAVFGERAALLSRFPQDLLLELLEGLIARSFVLRAQRDEFEDLFCNPPDEGSAWIRCVTGTRNDLKERSNEQICKDLRVCSFRGLCMSYRYVYRARGSTCALQ